MKLELYETQRDIRLGSWVMISLFAASILRSTKNFINVKHPRQKKKDFRGHNNSIVHRVLKLSKIFLHPRCCKR